MNSNFLWINFLFQTLHGVHPLSYPDEQMGKHWQDRSSQIPPNALHQTLQGSKRHRSRLHHSHHWWSHLHMYQLPSQLQASGLASAFIKAPVRLVLAHGEIWPYFWIQWIGHYGTSNPGANDRTMLEDHCLCCSSSSWHVETEWSYLGRSDHGIPWSKVQKVTKKYI